MAWGQMKEYLISNPDQARQMDKESKDPDAIRGALVTACVNAYFTPKLEAKDDPIQDQLRNLQNDSELNREFQDAKRDGIEALRKLLSDERVTRKVAQKANIPAELRGQLDKIASEPVTMQEAAKLGDLKYVEECVEKCLKSGMSVDVQDAKGVTALGYAVATGNSECMKFLLGSRADAFCVDSKGNSALHYAAGYGRKAECSYLVDFKADVNQTNKMGQTPLAVASLNKKSDCVDFLKSKGGNA